MKLLRLRWHEFYVLLAAFDLFVMVGAIALHHSALTGFRGLLEHFARFDQAERWLATLRETLIGTNAAGNDAVHAGTVQTYRNRFMQLVESMEKERRQSILAPERMARFWDHVAAMHSSERQLFALLEASPAPPAANDIVTKLAEMSRHKARALRQLDKEGGRLLSEAATAQFGHQALAERHEIAEKILAAVLLLNIAGMLWYRRRLQLAHDVLTTEQQRLDSERRDRLAAIGEICSGVAHGIQNPLAAIHSSAELIVEMGRIDPATRQRAQDILAESGRLSSRVARLLAFGRAEIPQRQSVDIRRVLDECVAELSARFESGRIRPAILTSQSHVVVFTDPHELASVVIELISNALDFAPAESEVRIACRCVKDYAEIEISDQGPGIPASHRDDIFKLFYTTRSGGTGVGLAAAKRTVESMGGRLDLIDSSSGVGASFRVILPLANE